MKKTPILLIVSLFFPLSTALAYSDYYPSTPLSQTSSFNLGGTNNPINVRVEPTTQYSNQLLQSSLNQQYGSFAVRSCMNRIPSCGGDMSDPRSQTACLQAVQYNLESGRCQINNAPTQTYTPPVYVYPTYPVIINPAKQGPSCGEGTLLVNNKCVSYSESCRISYGSHTYGDKDHCYCDSGYEWSADNKSCVQPISVHISNAATGETFGGAGGSGSYTPQDFNKQCMDAYGPNSRWDGSVDDAAKKFGCGCDDGYRFNDAQTLCVAAPKVVEAESQVASLALLADWQAPAVEESTQKPRRGFWSWLLGLFGL